MKVWKILQIKANTKREIVLQVKMGVLLLKNEITICFFLQIHGNAGISFTLIEKKNKNNKYRMEKGAILTWILTHNKAPSKTLASSYSILIPVKLHFRQTDLFDLDGVKRTQQS